MLWAQVYLSIFKFLMKYEIASFNSSISGIDSTYGVGSKFEWDQAPDWIRIRIEA